MTVKRRQDGWWVCDVPETQDCGPYDTRGEADDDRRGLERFFKYENRKGFITTDKR